MGKIDRDASKQIDVMLKVLNSTERKMLVKAMYDIEKILSKRSVNLTLS